MKVKTKREQKYLYLDKIDLNSKDSISIRHEQTRGGKNLRIQRQRGQMDKKNKIQQHAAYNRPASGLRLLLLLLSHFSRVRLCATP